MEGKQCTYFKLLSPSTPATRVDPAAVIGATMCWQLLYTSEHKHFKYRLFLLRDESQRYEDLNTEALQMSLSIS